MQRLKGEIKRFLLERDVDLIGFTDVSELYVEFKTAIVFAVSLSKLSHLAMKYSTTLEAFIPYFIDRIAFDLIWLLKGKGYLAMTRFMEEENTPIPLRFKDPNSIEIYKLRLQHRELAISAGLGTMGKIGLLVTPSFGPRIQLMSVLTNAIIPSDAPLDFDPCKDCNSCLMVCPYLQSKGLEEHAAKCWRCRACIYICPVGKQNHAK